LLYIYDIGAILPC